MKLIEDDVEKMRDREFSVLGSRLSLHFLLDKIIDCHYTL